MQEASFLGFFRGIIYILGFYYLSKFLIRLFAPMLLKGMVNKVHQNIEKQQNSGQTAPKADEKFSKNSNPKSTQKVGDYIDYEEID
jgi:hypothetical protein